jgi:hypothetical protein
MLLCALAHLFRQRSVWFRPKAAVQVYREFYSLLGRLLKNLVRRNVSVSAHPLAK